MCALVHKQGGHLECFAPATTESSGPHDAVSKLCDFLRTQSSGGVAKSEKSKVLLRQLAARGASLPDVGTIKTEDVEEAIHVFEASLKMPQMSGACKSSIIDSGAKASTLPRMWKLRAAVQSRQGPSLQSPVLRTLHEGEIVTEMVAPREFPGWVAIKPRGWIPSDGLALMSSPTSVHAPGVAPFSSDLVRSSVDDQSETLSPIYRNPLIGCSRRLRGSLLLGARENDAVEAWAGKRTADVAAESESQKRARVGSYQHLAKSPDEGICIYVLDGLNILKYRNDESRPLALSWPQLFSAGRYFKEKHKVHAFLRRTNEWSPSDVTSKKFIAEVGENSIIRCPPGASDDTFMIQFVIDKEKEAGCKVRIVTNDLFRDHSNLVDQAWVHEHTVKYIFVDNQFVPEVVK